ELKSRSDSLVWHAAQLRALAAGRCTVSPTPPVCAPVSRNEVEVLGPAIDRLISAIDAEKAVLASQ
ncbi:MAG TPA: hypothetical protein VLQ79_02465, partial [Myxococcaceae bacterium]|nr:hypothetical protein [Myxococcaceae bacterium]